MTNRLRFCSMSRFRAWRRSSSTSWPAIRRMIDEHSNALVLVEQHAEIALSLMENVLVLERGRIVHRGPSAKLLADHAALERLIGLRLAEV